MTAESATGDPVSGGGAVRAAGPGTWPAIERLLCDANLPLAGARACLARFRVICREDGILGCAATERYGDRVLLRSVAVRSDVRGRGLAERLCVAALEEAAREGANRAYLLTVSAEGFFPRFGFRPVTRLDLPLALHASPEIQGACPDTARVLSVALRVPLPWVRRALPEDAEAVTAIHAQGIEDRIATLDETPDSVADREAWLRGRTERTPVIVAVVAGAVAGWASLNSFTNRAAYRHVADLSVYVERTHRGRGLGTLLLGELIRRARDLGYHKLVLTALPFNAPGMALYTRMGFRTVGRFHEQGRLDGRWVDTVVMERLL